MISLVKLWTEISMFEKFEAPAASSAASSAASLNNEKYDCLKNIKMSTAASSAASHKNNNLGNLVIFKHHYLFQLHSVRRRRWKECLQCQLSRRRFVPRWHQKFGPYLQPQLALLPQLAQLRLKDTFVICYIVNVQY